jgi:hypothetical protein
LQPCHGGDSHLSLNSPSSIPDQIIIEFTSGFWAILYLDFVVCNFYVVIPHCVCNWYSWLRTDVARNML